MRLKLVGTERNTRVAVVIPCYRVERHIAEVIRTVPAYVNRIICVDDASPDSSAAVIEALGDPRVVLVRHPKNQGVGGAMVTGYRKALELEMDVAVKMDGDGQMDPEYLPDLVMPLLRGEADYTKGNRWEDANQLATMPTLRRIGSLGLSFLTKLASGNWRLFDPCNGYTAIRASTLRRLDLGKISKDYFFETCMLVEISIFGGVSQDVAIPARYGDEESSMSIGRVLRRFPPMLAKSCVRRVWQQYFIRNFVPASLFLMAGLMLFGGGFLFGAIAWWQSIASGIAAPTGTIMLSVVPLLMGFQLLVHAAVLDIANQPTAALCGKDRLSETLEVGDSKDERFSNAA